MTSAPWQDSNLGGLHLPITSPTRCPLPHCVASIPVHGMMPFADTIPKSITEDASDQLMARFSQLAWSLASCEDLPSF